MALRADQHCEVILVDDDDDDFIYFQQALRAYSGQIAIRHFAEGATLIQHLQTTDAVPSLIVLDINIPVVDGHELLTLLKQSPTLKDIPVVVWSGYLHNEAIDRCY